ncbi:MAG: hypothetical protein MUE30_10870 [Spirosomaceae bacterium]|nr:hypothetical protein [Spirosomataceae bacterium]
MFEKTFNNPVYKPYLRLALVVASISILSFIGHAVAYHREWFKVPFSKYATIKIALKSLKWIGVALIFWFGKKYFNQNKSQSDTSQETAYNQ